VITALAAVPFINLLFRLKFQRQKEVHVLSPIFTKLHAWKVGTPNSGGVLIILVTVILGAIFTQVPLDQFYLTPVGILLIALISYGALGLYDDVRKYFGYSQTSFWGMRLRYKLGLQIILGLTLGWLLFKSLAVGGVIPLQTYFFGIFDVGPEFYIPFAALTIIAAANAVNITDGVDGLATGLIIMSLLTILTIAGGGVAVARFAQDTTQLQEILFIWTGAMLAFLYFNIHPARVWMGDSGALAFGGGLAVASLLLGIPLLLPIFGAIYLVETVSSLLQWYSMRYRPKKFFLIAPLHHHFEAKGWPETKVTMRFWLAGALMSLVGLYIYYYFSGL
jgi:phospho-N-acetylmuramoyl-pentapeptide-transferase